LTSIHLSVGSVRVITRSDDDYFRLNHSCDEIAMTKRICLIAVTITFAALLPGTAVAQSGISTDSPVVHADGRVTFRVRAPDADSVLVVPKGRDNGLGSGPYELEKDTEGVWSSTTPPVRSGFHYYELSVNGFACNDPGVPTFFGWGRETSGLEVPDPDLDFYRPKDVVRGQVRIHPYYSRTTEHLRRAYVYTPPGYDQTPDVRYPVLYLQHGAGESEKAWTEQGMAHVILDNLLAEQRAVPMLMVMDNGYAARPDATNRRRPDRGDNRFADLVVNELVPMIDNNYRTFADRDHRAIAGLSMGGGQALSIGLLNLDVFASIGALSAAQRNFDPATSYGGALADPVRANRRLKLLWIGCGTEDFLYGPSTAFHARLTADGINHVWYDGPGAHEWQVWRRHLYELAPLLFRDRSESQ
jgi:enterochelin esterase family protein